MDDLEHRLFPFLGTGESGLLASLNKATYAGIVKNRKIDYGEIMFSYLNWLTKRDYGRPPETDAMINDNIIESLIRYSGKTPAVECGESSELRIDNSSLMRGLYLPFYLDKNVKQSLFAKESSVAVIRHFTYLTNRHFRAVVAEGIYVNIVYRLLKKTKENPQGRISLKRLTRLAVKEALAYYSSTFDHYREVRYFAPLEANKNGRMHIEDYPFAQLNIPNSAVDALLMFVWFVYNKTSIKEMEKEPSGIRLIYILYRSCEYIINYR